MESTPLRGGIGLFLKNFYSNFRSHIKDSKWGRKCIFINCTSCNESPQQIPFQFANGKLPHSCCRAFWAVSILVIFLEIWRCLGSNLVLLKDDIIIMMKEISIQSWNRTCKRSGRQSTLCCSINLATLHISCANTFLKFTIFYKIHIW